MTAKPETLSSLQSKNIQDDGYTFTISKVLYTAMMHAQIKKFVDALSVLEKTYSSSKLFLNQQFIERDPLKRLKWQ